MTVRHVTAHVRHVDVPVGMLRVRLGLADEHAALKTAHICVPWSLDDHEECFSFGHGRSGCDETGTAGMLKPRQPRR